MKHNGFSLLECVFTISIAITSCTVAISGLRHFLYTHNANITLRQIQQSIELARSIAIANSHQVTISCNNSTLIISANNQDIKLIKLHIGSSDAITLYQSGLDGKKVTIQANGMTYNNGHFNYSSLKSNSLPQFNLYFNRALRTYALKHG